MDKFTIIMPPPNVTGSFHMGHALTYVIQDFFIRYKKLRDYDSYWQPGYDHAGIAMQMLSKKNLESKGLTNVSREDFIKFMYKEKDLSIKNINNQINKMKMDVDWTKAVFTLDDIPSKAVKKIFIDLYNDGIIYKDKRLINWDMDLQTSISNLEVVTKEVNGKMYYIKYYFLTQLESDICEKYNINEVSDNNIDCYVTQKYVVIATTRPETIFADSALAISDAFLAKYPFLKNKQIYVPIINKKINIIIDDYADPNKGTGIVKITPAHDFNDFNVGKKHKLEVINIFDKNLCLIEGPFMGENLKNARKLTLTELKKNNYLLKEEDCVQQLPYGDRSGVLIEPRLSDQWFLDAEQLAQNAIDVVEKDEITFEPYHWKSTYLDWMQNIEPWCISRQLVWGHRIPAWYDNDGNIYVADNKQEAQKQAGEKEIVQDSDVLDTWFSSGLWAMSSLGWPEKDIESRYPSDILVTGFDIIFFWVARMIMMSLYAVKEIPFKKVYISQIVLDDKGEKMSKTKGNTKDPLEIIEKYSSNELRISLLFNVSAKRNMNFGDENLIHARNFMTKLRNAIKFCELYSEYESIDIIESEILSDFNKWIVNCTYDMIKEFYFYIDKHDIQSGLFILKNFIWNKFCSWYIEYVKTSKPQYQNETHFILHYVKSIILSLLQSVIPEFVEEQLYEKINIKEFLKKYKKSDDKKACDIINIVSEIRSVKSIIGVDQNCICNIYINFNDPLIDYFAKVKNIDIENKIEIKKINTFDGELSVFFEKIENMNILKKMNKMIDQIDKLNKKLKNERFLEKASPDIVVKDKDNLKILKENVSILKKFV